MTVSDIITMAAKMVFDNSTVGKIERGEELSEDEESDVNRLIDAYNMVLNEIAIEYYPIFFTDEKTGQTIDFAELTYQPLIVEKVTDKKGRAVQFKVLPTAVEMLKYDTYLIRYAYVPPKRSEQDEFEYQGSKISARVFAYGVAAEFCLVMGRYNEAVNWDGKFRKSLGSTLTRGAKKIKGRVWGL